MADTLSNDDIDRLLEIGEQQRAELLDLVQRRSQRIQVVVAQGVEITRK